MENISLTIQNYDNSAFIESVILKVSSKDKDSNFSQNEQTEEKEHSTKYFKCLLRKEKDRLQKVCDEWMTIQSQDNITEDIRSQINQAIGQTTMLIKEKFQQFWQLTLVCKKGKDNSAETKITCTDLLGFWDMMYIQVKDCISRFTKLDELRAANWCEQLLPIESPSAKSKTLNRNSLRTSMFASRRKKELAKIRNARERSIKVNDIINTPSNNKMDASCRRKLLESCKTHKIYTSTPFITMKVSRFYRPNNMPMSPVQFNQNETQRAYGTNTEKELKKHCQ